MRLFSNLRVTNRAVGQLMIGQIYFPKPTSSMEQMMDASRINIRWCKCLLLGLLCAYFQIGMAQRIVPYNPITGDSIIPGSALPAFVQFRVENLPPPPASSRSANFPDWTYYWTFGDCKKPSLAREPVHVYQPANDPTYQVSLILTGIYSDDEDLEALIYPPDTSLFMVGPVSDPQQLLPELTPRPSFNIGIIPVREASPGQLVTYLIPYRTYFSGLTGGTIHMEFPREILTPALSLLDSCNYLPPAVNLPGLEGSLRFDLDAFEPNDQKMLRVSFLTNENAPIGEPFQLTVFYDDAYGVISKDSLLAMVVDSQDPNDKLVRDKKVCPGAVMDYTVRFENLGNAAANLVTIIDHIDTLLDLNTLVATANSMPGAPLSMRYDVPLDPTFNPNTLVPQALPLDTPQITLLIDTNASKAAWVFHSIDLPPAGSPYNKGFTSYSIKLRNAINPSWQRFGKHASIYFDDNDEIPTKAAVAHIKPCYCVPKKALKDHFFLDSVELNGKKNQSEFDDGYVNYATVDWVVNKGSSNTLSASFHKPLANTDQVYWRAWIDTDRDGLFEWTEKIVQEQGESISKVFDLPSGVSAGPAVLRVAAQMNSYPTSCTLVSAGEMEDYEILIESTGNGDLKALMPTVENRVLIPGQNNTVMGKYSNTGPASVAASTIGYYLSQDAYYSADDFALKTHATVYLQDGALHEDLTTFFVPNTETGFRYLLTVLDSADTLLENQEGNNITAQPILVSPLQPDLSITSALSCQPAIRQNTNLSISCRVTNNGAAAIPFASDVKLGIYVSANPQFDSTAVLAGALAIPDLAVGASAHLATKMDFGSYPAFPAGNYFVLVVADYDQQLLELDEGNNEASVALETKADFYNSTPYAIGFECGGLDAGWATDMSGNNSVTKDELIAWEGSHFATVGSNWGHTGLGHLDLHLDLNPSQHLALDFQWTSAGFVSKGLDGLFMSVDQGSTFYKVYTFPNSLSVQPGWHHFHQSLDTLAATQNLSMGDSIILRWQFDDITLLTIDGIALDSLRVFDAGSTTTKWKDAEVKNPSTSVHVFPNPSRESTTISYEVSANGKPVEIRCFDALGHLQETLLVEKSHPAGKASYTFMHRGWPAGVYYCTVRIGRDLEVRKLILLD